MYKTLISSPVSLYGSESWNMTTADENANEYVSTL
jgi:hypothetical protein